MGPRNEKNPPEKIMHGAVKFIGALIIKIQYMEGGDNLHMSCIFYANSEQALQDFAGESLQHNGAVGNKINFT